MNITSYNNEHGLYIHKSNSNIFTNITIYNNYYGVYLYDRASNNNLTNIKTYNNTLSEIFIKDNSVNNTFKNAQIGNYVNISFIYDPSPFSGAPPDPLLGSISIDDVDNPPPNPLGWYNISKYVNITNIDGPGWLWLNISYSDSDITKAGINESTLKIWKYSQGWQEFDWNGSRVLDEVNNIVGVNITSFSIFAPLGQKIGAKPDIIVSDITVNYNTPCTKDRAIGPLPPGTKTQCNNISATISEIYRIDITSPFNVKFKVNETELNCSPVRVPAGALKGGGSVTVYCDCSFYPIAGETYNISVIADSDNEIPETNETNNILWKNVTAIWNGYKGNGWQDGREISTSQCYKGKINLVYSLGNSYRVGGSKWTTYEVNWTPSDFDIPQNSNIIDARLYVYYSDEKTPDGDPTNMSDGYYVNLSFNGRPKTHIAHYTDRKGFGYYNYPYGMIVYNVTTEFDSTRNNTAVLIFTRPSGGHESLSIDGMLLVIVYNHPNEPGRTIWINDGFDLIGATTSCGVSSEEATAYARFNGCGPISLSNVDNAKLITVAPHAFDGDDKNRLYFNGHVWKGIWSGYPPCPPGKPNFPHLGISEIDVSKHLKATDNVASFQSHIPAGATYGDLMAAGNAFLIVEEKHEEIEEEVKPLIRRRRRGCFERWNCTEWGPCINGTQTRICYDIGTCKRPPRTETRECVVQPVPTPAKPEPELKKEKPLLPAKPCKPPFVILILIAAVLAYSVYSLAKLHKARIEKEKRKYFYYIFGGSLIIVAMIILAYILCPTSIENIAILTIASITAIVMIIWTGYIMYRSAGFLRPKRPLKERLELEKALKQRLAHEDEIIRKSEAALRKQLLEKVVPPTPPKISKPELKLKLEEEKTLLKPEEELLKKVEKEKLALEKKRKKQLKEIERKLKEKLHAEAAAIIEPEKRLRKLLALEKARKVKARIRRREAYKRKRLLKEKAKLERKIRKISHTLNEFILKAIARGLHKQEIKSLLINAGWNAKLIEKYLDKFYKINAGVIIRLRRIRHELEKKEKLLPTAERIDKLLSRVDEELEKLKKF